MQIWDGFGANTTPHKGGTLNAADTLVAIAYLQEMKNFGIHRIRCHIPDYNSAGAVIQDYILAENCRKAGMDDYNVGVSANSFNNIKLKISLSNWQTYRNFLLVDDGQNGMGMAEYAKRHAVPRLYIGNEEESHHTFKASSAHGTLAITSNGNIATATLSQTNAQFNFVNGQNIIVGGASQSAYNGTFPITLVNSTTLTYVMGSAPGTPATGGYYLEDFTDAQLRGMLKQLATDVKTLWQGIPGTNPLICYSTPSDTGGDLPNSADGWASETSLGDIDMLGLNVYGNGNLTTFTNMVNAFAAAFGPTGTVAPGQGYVTEWNIHQDWNSTIAHGLSVTNYDFWEAFSTEILKRLDVIKNSGLTPAFYFTYWNISVSTPDQWALKIAGSKYDKMRSQFVPGRLTQAFYRLVGQKPYEVARASRRNSVRKITDLHPMKARNFTKCILFNQPTSMLQFTAPAAWTAGYLNKVSIAMRIYPLSIDTPTIRLFDCLSIILYCYNIGIQAQVKFSSADGLGVSGPDTVPTNKWIDVFMTYDQSQANTNYPVICIDMFERQSSTPSNASGTMTGTAGQPVTIGNRGSQDRAFNGYIESFAMWRNTDEANMVDFRKGIIRAKDLLVGLPMNETSGNPVDISSNGVIVTATDVQMGQDLPAPFPN